MSSCNLLETARAEEPYVLIQQCGTILPTANTIACAYNITTTQQTFDLDCTVRGGKPYVSISWEEDKKNYAISEQLMMTDRPDGTFDWTVRLKVNASILQTKSSFVCTAQGIAVNGTASGTITVQAVEPKAEPNPPQGKLPFFCT